MNIRPSTFTTNLRLAAGPASLETLAGDAAERAAELRTVVGKGARAQKKKALGDFLQALGAAGASRSRAAVPADQRTTSSWFMQVSSCLMRVFGWTSIRPAAGACASRLQSCSLGIAGQTPRLQEVLHLAGVVFTGQAPTVWGLHLWFAASLLSEHSVLPCSLDCASLQEPSGAYIQAALEQPQHLAAWEKADAYFYRSTASIQQLWQVGRVRSCLRSGRAARPLCAHHDLAVGQPAFWWAAQLHKHCTRL